MTPDEFKELRNTLGMSISETALICGVGVRTVRRWESPNRTPDPHPSGCKILEYLGTGELVIESLCWDRDYDD